MDLISNIFVVGKCEWEKKIPNHSLSDRATSCKQGRIYYVPPRKLPFLLSLIFCSKFKSQIKTESIFFLQGTGIFDLILKIPISELRLFYILDAPYPPT